MTALTAAINVARFTYTPFRFRPSVEHTVAIGLSVSALALWVVVLPLEFILAF